MAANPADHSVPRRVLVVESDPAARDAVVAGLADSNIEVGVAADGEEALTLLGRQWYPVVVTARSTQVLDGIEFVYRLRAVAVAPVYVIMLTEGNDAHDFERGYCAGVDHYVARQGQQRVLLPKVLAGLTAIRRRQVAHTSRGDGLVIVDLESGAHTARHLVGRLHAEIAHAHRNSQRMSVMSVCIEPAGAGRATDAIPAAASDALLQAVHGAVRPKLDWVARLPASRTAFRLAVVMPDAAGAEIAAVEQGLRNAFVRAAEAPSLRATQLTIGAITLEGGPEVPTALGLLGEAERQRRGGAIQPHGDLGNVQGG